MEERITPFMIQEHGKILVLLNNFKKNSMNLKAEKSFKELEKALDRHVLAEEKAIMILTNRKRNFKEMALILEQHEQIKKLMENIKDHLKRKLDNFKENLKELLEIMKRHIVLENTRFYPKLDEELEGNERKIIFEKLHDAIIGNIMI